MRLRVVRALKPLDAISVENPVHPGTPDVNYVHGWIELKALPVWPAKPTSPVRLDHFRPEQKVWIARRIRHGGRVDLLLRVDREWLRFRDPDVILALGLLDRAELYRLASQRWTTTPTNRELLACFQL